MKRLALACACGAILIWAAPPVHAQIRPVGGPQPPFPGGRPDAPGRNDDRDRGFSPANFVRPVYVPLPAFRPEPMEPHMPPVEPSFKAPPVSEFEPLIRSGEASGEVGCGAIGGVGATITGAIGALFGFRRKKGGGG